MIQYTWLVWDLQPGQIDGERVLPRYGITMTPGVPARVAEAVAAGILQDYECVRVSARGELAAAGVMLESAPPPTSVPASVAVALEAASGDLAELVGAPPPERVHIALETDAPDAEAQE